MSQRWQIDCSDKEQYANNFQIHNANYQKYIIMDQEEQHLETLIESTTDQFYSHFAPHNVITTLLKITDKLHQLTQLPTNASYNFQGSITNKAIQIIKNPIKHSQPQSLKQLAWDHNILQIMDMSQEEKEFMKQTATHREMDRKQQFYLMHLWDASMTRNLTPFELHQMNQDETPFQLNKIDIDISYEITKLEKVLETKRRTVIWKNMDLIFTNNKRLQKQKYQDDITSFLTNNNEWKMVASGNHRRKKRK